MCVPNIFSMEFQKGAFGILHTYMKAYKLLNLRSLKFSHLNQLEQLECLHSEDTPPPPWLPILLIHIGPQVKPRQCQSYKCEESVKTLNFVNFDTNFTQDTSSEVAW